MDSRIINKNKNYINNIIGWFESKNNIKTELLYRRTDDGDSCDKFHDLCDNKGKTLLLIKGLDGFIIGAYTPLDWDNCSGWKKDNNSFIFSLTNNKIFNKNKNNIESIKCSKDYGPNFHCLAFKRESSMSILYLSKGCSNYKNLDELLPNGAGNHKLEEVEVYKISFN